MTETYDPQAIANQQEPVVEGNALPQSEATEEQAVNAADTQEIQQNKYEGMQTCEDIVARIKVLAEDPLNAPKEELDQLKQAKHTVVAQTCQDFTQL